MKNITYDKANKLWHIRIKGTNFEFDKKELEALALTLQKAIFMDTPFWRNWLEKHEELDDDSRTME
jgi:hypothetical protein